MALDQGTEAAQPPRSEPTPVPRARGWFRHAVFASSGAYAKAIVTAAVLNILALAVPLFALIALDQVAVFSTGEQIWPIAAGICVVLALDLILRMLRQHFAEAAGDAAMARIDARVMQRLLCARIESGDRNPSAVLANDLADLRGMMSAAPILAAVDLPFVILFLAACYLVGGPVALVPLIAVPAVLFLNLVLQLPLRVTAEQDREAARRRLSIAEETAAGLETIKTVAGEDRGQRLWGQAALETQRLERRTQALGAWIQGLSGVATSLVLAGVIGYGSYLAFNEQLTVGGLVAAALLAVLAMAAVERLAAVAIAYRRGRAALAALGDVMRMPVERPEGLAFSGPSRLQGDIALQNVVSRYPGQSVPAVDGVTLQIEAGEKVGLIGRMGSGKSTILRLILGLYAPDSGLVAIDGQDIAQCDPAVLRTDIGCLPQTVDLFDGSIEDNIALGARGRDDEAIARAARLAGVDSIAEKFPEGLKTPLGAFGHALSAGERQAVAAARALYGDPPILLLDEPTGLFDNTSEGRFRARLANALGDKTLLLVTNRSAMLSLVDRLIVVDGGRIVADGRKQDVLDGLQGGVIQTAQVSE